VAHQQTLTYITTVYWCRCSRNCKV